MTLEFPWTEIDRAWSTLRASSRREDKALVARVEERLVYDKTRLRPFGRPAAEVPAAGDSTPPALPPSGDAFDALCALLPAQFDEVVYRLGITTSHLPGGNALQSSKALAVVQWVNANGKQADLDRLLDKRPASPAPASAPVVLIWAIEEDRRAVEELTRHLVPMQRSGVLTFRSCLDIPPGVLRSVARERMIAEASVVLAVLTTGAIADNDMDAALVRFVAAPDLRVVPVIYSTCEWKLSPVGKLTALPANANPIAEWKSRDTAWVEVAQDVRRVVSRSKS